MLFLYKIKYTLNTFSVSFLTLNLYSITFKNFLAFSCEWMAHHLNKKGKTEFSSVVFLLFLPKNLLNTLINLLYLGGLNLTYFLKLYFVIMLDFKISCKNNTKNYHIFFTRSPQMLRDTMLSCLKDALLFCCRAIIQILFSVVFLSSSKMASS